MSTGIQSLRLVFQESQSDEAPEWTDVTLSLQTMYEDRNIHIERARLNQDGYLYLVVGLRSHILSPFPRVKKVKTGRFMPCDMIGLVPLVSLLVGRENKGVELGAITTEKCTQIVMGFQAENTKTLARDVYDFITTWKKWSSVLENVVKKDYPIDFDVLEFLSEESGYVGSNWQDRIKDRDLPLSIIVRACRSLLQSVLTTKQLSHPLLHEIMTWLDGLRPQLEIHATAQEVLAEV